MNNRRTFIKSSCLIAPAIILGTNSLLSSNYKTKYKTPNSVFTVGEIDDFCNEWGWLHINNSTTPSNNSTYTKYKFIGIDGKQYTAIPTFRSHWIGNIKTNTEDKEEFKNFVKCIAGNYYWKGKREHYYFYDVVVTGGGPYDCNWMKEFDKNHVPNECELKSHGKPLYNVILIHVGVSNGKEWGYCNQINK